MAMSDIQLVCTITALKIFRTGRVTLTVGIHCVLIVKHF